MEMYRKSRALRQFTTRGTHTTNQVAARPRSSSHQGGVVQTIQKVLGGEWDVEEEVLHAGHQDSDVVQENEIGRAHSCRFTESRELNAAGFSHSTAEVYSVGDNFSVLLVSQRRMEFARLSFRKTMLNLGR